MEEKFSKSAEDTLEVSRVQSELSRLAEESLSRIEYRRVDILHRGCLCEAIKRLPWERAKHICISSDGNITDADFYGVEGVFGPPAP